MSAESLIDQITGGADQTNLCVVLRPGVSGLEVLIVADEQGRWSLPGGHVNGTESHAEACTREVKEETGLVVTDLQPLFLISHAARQRPATLFYTTVDEDTEAAPGGGDVTAVKWVKLTALGSLNGSDRLAIMAAASRVHNAQALVDDEVGEAEAKGYAVGNVSVPPLTVEGVHIRLTGPACMQYAERLREWAEDVGIPTALYSTVLCDSSQDALIRARLKRQLTPMLDALLRVSDQLWTYESKTAPKLTEGQLVIEYGNPLDTAHLLSRGVEPELLDCLVSRLPQPSVILAVGESVVPAELEALKESVEHLRGKLKEGVDDPEAYIADLPPRQAYLKAFVDGGTCTHAQAVEYACLCAEGVLHIFEQDYPQDQRPRQAIEVARRWLAEPTEANRLHAADAAYAATYAANTAAASAAAYAAASAAAYAASDAAASAAGAAAASDAAAAAAAALRAGGT